LTVLTHALTDLGGQGYLSWAKHLDPPGQGSSEPFFIYPSSVLRVAVASLVLADTLQL
jgi:hypothetical protein